MKNKNPNSFYAKYGTLEKDRNAGTALATVSLLIWYSHHAVFLITLAVLFLFITMTFPKVLRPLTIGWYGLSLVAGSIVSGLMLWLIYSIVVVPVALVRRISGKDDLLLKQFKKSSASVLQTRKRLITPQDFQNPF